MSNQTQRSVRAVSPRPALEFYKNALERLGGFIAEQLHPDYGPCDGLADGNCSVCLQVLATLKEAAERRGAEAERRGAEAEREECAKLAETYFAGAGWHPAAKNAALIIAENVRARTDKGVKGDE